MIIDGLKPYPAMKDSGVPWLGEVPEHWPVDRLKSWVNDVNVQTAERRTGDLYIALEHVTSWTGRLRPLAVDAAFDSQVKRFRAGDVLFGKLRPYLAKVTRPPSDGVCVGEFLVLRPRGSDGSAPYLEQLLRSKPVIDAVSSSTFGAKMPRADWQFVGSMPITRPPASEQAAIVRFLDYVDRRIGWYLRAKQKLIKLLEEQKQAIIHRAVTRGLDPNVRLKPSGVEWLGDVPEHWEVARASTVCSFHSAKAHEQFVEPDGEHICVTARFVSTDGRSFRRCTKNFSPAQQGDVLMVMSDLPRGRALARSYLVTDDRSYAVNQRVCILRPARVHPQFLAFVANRHPELLAHDDGFNQTHLPNAAFKIMRLPLPPLGEQALIAEFLSREDATHTGAALRAEREIDLLHEYRTRLIADVVTGKLDVREAAMRLSDERSEPEPADEGRYDSSQETEGDDEPGEEANAG